MSIMIAIQQVIKRLFINIPALNMPLNIVVIGAGLGGLAAALSIKQEAPTHDVLVVESAPVLAEVVLSSPHFP
jgi:NADPH-dependent 2,4-dienoyl-CoA reductase/sulfur reductase-like enzyme